MSVAVGGLLLVLITNSTGIFYKEFSKIQNGLNINDSLYEIKEDIKQSSAIVETYTNGSITYSSGSFQIVLKLFAIDSSGNIISDVFDYFIYFIDGNKLRFKTFPDNLSSRKAQDRVFSNNVDSLEFKYLNSVNPPLEVSPINATKVRITIKLKQRNGLDSEINIATSEANLINN